MLTTQDIIDLLENNYDTSRAYLRNLIGRYVNFSGEISLVGSRPKKVVVGETKKTILLIDVIISYENSIFNIDHIWIDYTKKMKTYKIGSRYHFTGKVKTYERENGTNNFKFINVVPWK